MTAESLRQDFEKYIAEFLKKHALAVENLTEQQFASAIRQAIECGDFQKLVREGDNAQQVIYVPFAREEELRSKIIELERELADHEVDGG